MVGGWTDGMKYPDRARRGAFVMAFVQLRERIKDREETSIDEEEDE